jgi:hypothetical protein
MVRMERTVSIIVLTTVTITCVMLCLDYVYRVVEKDGWAHTVNNVSLLGLSYKK